MASNPPLSGPPEHDSGPPGIGEAARKWPAYFLRFGARWLNALAAAVLDALLVRRSRSTFEAAFAARGDVFRLRAITPPFYLVSVIA